MATRALVAEVPLMGFECRPAFEVSVSSVGMWTEPGLASVDDGALHFLVICPTLGDLTTARNRLGSRAREAIALARSGLWIEADPTI